MKFYQRKEYEDLYCLLVMAVESSNCTHASENHKGKYVGQYCLKKKLTAQTYTRDCKEIISTVQIK